MDATARAEEIASLASALDAAQAGLASVLEPVVEQHTENVWSGVGRHQKPPSIGL